jgi:hypothetical protein
MASDVAPLDGSTLVVDDRRFHNVFHYFRGPSASGETYDQQLENNATKALINVLEHSHPSVLQSFIARFVGVDSNIDRPSFGIEGGPETLASGTRSWLIAIASEPNIPVPPEGHSSDDGKGRIDASIYSPGELLVAIEVKVGDGQFDYAQLERHAKTWNVKEPWIPVAWRDIYLWAREQEAAEAAPISAFLLRQLAGFLRSVGLTPFVGLEAEDFSFFASEPSARSWEPHAIVKARIRELWTQVFSLLDRDERDQLGEIHVHQLKLVDTHLSAQSNADREGLVNLTLEIGATDAQLNLVGWMMDQAEGVERWLRSKGASVLPTTPRLEIVVYARRGLGYADREKPGKKPVFQKAPGFMLEPIPSTDFTLDRLDEVLSRVDPVWERAAYHIRASWSRDQVVAARQQFAGDLVDDIRVFLPWLAEMNSDKPPAGKSPHWWSPKAIDKVCGKRHRKYKRTLKEGYTSYFVDHPELASSHRFMARDPASTLPPGRAHVAGLVPPGSWHRYHLSGGSSQMLAVALLGSAIEVDPSLTWLCEALGLENGALTQPTVRFEHALGRETLGESPRVTNLDLLVESQDVLICIEAKLWEAGFGTCRCGEKDDADALQGPSEALPTPAQERAACSERILDRRLYWSTAEEVLGLPERREGSICPIASAYQPVRNIAAARALAKGRAAVFALMFDDRNPYFAKCDAWPGWPAVLEYAVRPDADVAFRSCSWQNLLGSGAVPDDVVAWAEEKHGLLPATGDTDG